VTETVVATLGPNDRWNQAALGVHAHGPASTRDADGSAPTHDADDSAPTRDADGHPDAVTAFTYGNTRTRRNLHGRGDGIVQFTRDAVDFTNAALDVHETDAPVLESADAWVRVNATQVDARDEEGTRIETWRLEPVDATVRRRVVPVVNRGHAAVVDATVAASRLGVAGFDDDALRARLDRAVDVVATCGGERERAAIRRVDALVDDWTPATDLPED